MALPYYRRRFPNEYVLANKVHHPRNVYLRQDAFADDFNGWLATAFAPHHLNHTIDQIMTAQHAEADTTTTAAGATARIADANRKMTRRARAVIGCTAERDRSRS